MPPHPQPQAPHQPWYTRLNPNFKLKRKPRPAKPPKPPKPPKKSKPPKPPKPPKPAKPHPLLHYELKANKRDWTLRLTARILALGILICVIVFGASRVVFGFQPLDLFGQSVDVDLQLALFGLLNKILDLLVTVTFEDVGGVTLTLWLAGYGAVFGRYSRGAGTGVSGGKGGVRLSDFELPQEFTKPWISISAFHRRRTFLGWRRAGIGRFIITLTTSVCVLLLGLSVNTVGIPKERWYPQDIQSYSSQEIQGIDTTYWGSGWNIVGNGAESWDAAKLYSAMNTYGALKTLPQLFDSSKHGWDQTAHDNDRSFVAMNTDLSGDVARAVAVQTEYAYQIFKWLQKNGKWPASAAIGWTATVDLTLPYVATECTSSGDTTNVSFTGTQTAIVVDDGPSLPTFTLFISNDSSQTQSNISNTNNTNTNNPLITTCTISLTRALFPLRTWVSDSASTAALSINNYGQAYNVTPTLLTPSQLDANISSNLATQLSIVLDIFDRTGLSLTSAQMIHGNAARICALRSDVESEQAVAAVVGMLSTTLLAYADWNVSMMSLGNTTAGSNNTQSQSLSQSQILTATTIQWQVYGSGPRLPWQWTTTIILAIVLLCMLFAIVQSLVHRLSASEVLKPGGMLVAASLAGELRGLRGAVAGGGVVTEEMVEGERVWVRSVGTSVGGQGGGQGSVLTDEVVSGGSRVEFRKRYTWVTP